jgi:glycosyltransferase involved in cell wall biosynthesis
LHRGYAPIHQLLRLLREMVPWETRLLLPVQAGRKTVEDAIFSLNSEEKSLLSVERGEEAARDVRCGASPVLYGTKPLVSILIPAFNAQEWIADTLRSAIAQTWKSKEIIVVDDGSTDQTLAIVRQFESQGIVAVRHENQGAAAARNKALSLSHGDYIQWLDADDLLAPDKIARQMDLVEQGVDKRTLFSSAWGRFMYRPHRAQFTPTALWCDLTPVECLLRKMGQNVYIQTASWLVSRELTEAAGSWNTRLSEDDDGEYFCRVLLASNHVRFVPNARVYYRTFGFDSLSYIGRSPQKLESHWFSMQLHIHHLRSFEDSPRVHAACLEYLRNSLIYFYPERVDIVRQAERMAMEFGEHLGVPGLSWKYFWIERVFGWAIVKPVQRLLRKFRWSMEKRLDKVLFRIENRKRLLSVLWLPTRPFAVKERTCSCHTPGVADGYGSSHT